MKVGYHHPMTIERRCLRECEREKIHAHEEKKKKRITNLIGIVLPSIKHTEWVTIEKMMYKSLSAH